MRAPNKAKRIKHTVPCAGHWDLITTKRVSFVQKFHSTYGERNYRRIVCFKFDKITFGETIKIN